MAKGQGRSQNQRLKLLYLRDYLLENTDETHTVKTQQIIEFMEREHQIPVERKTVWSDLHLLDEYGTQIEYDTKDQAYRVIEREFELYELQLLIDSVQSSRFITQRQAKSLTEKLKAKASRYERPLLDRRCYVANRIRSKNDSVFYSLDDLHIAISNDWQISFRYFNFNSRKEKVYYKKGEAYTASPYALLWNDNNYYLYAYESGKLKNFRVDRMDGINIVYAKREGKKEFAEKKLTERSLKVFSMFSGAEQRVKMRFSNHLAGVVIDRFGRDIVMAPDGDRHFIFMTDIEVSSQFYGWLCGLGRGVKVLSPPEVVEGMANYVKGISQMYEDEERE